FDQAVRVGTVFRTDHQQQVRITRDLLHCDLAVFSGVADVLRGRLVDVGKLFLQGFDDLSSFIKRERSLRDVGDLVWVGNGDVLYFFRIADDLRDRGRFAQRANDFFMVTVPDKEQRVTLFRKL